MDWFRSIKNDTLPKEEKAKGQRTFRSITIDGEELEFSNGFTHLHTRSYDKILAGDGFRLDDCRQAIVIVYQIRIAEHLGLNSDYHPYARKTLTRHPFYSK